MKRLVIWATCLATLAISAQDNRSPSKGKEWKIMRQPATNDCIVMKMTAGHPGYIEQLGTYDTMDQAKAAFEVFKKEPDPKKPGFEMCTNK